MGYYKEPERWIHSGSNNLEDIDLDLINYFMDCVCSQSGKNLKDIATDLGICVIHDLNTGYREKEMMPDRDLVANKLMEYAKNNGVEISGEEALRITDANIYNASNMTNIFEHYTTLSSPTYAEVKGTRDNYTAIDSKFPIIEELLRRGVPVDIEKACKISPKKGISDQKIVHEGRGYTITAGIIDSPSKELEAMLNSDLEKMINGEASEESDANIAGRSIK